MSLRAGADSGKHPRRRDRRVEDDTRSGFRTGPKTCLATNFLVALWSRRQSAYGSDHDVTELRAILVVGLCCASAFGLGTVGAQEAVSKLPPSTAQAASVALPRARQQPVKLLGWNDFHGQLSPKQVAGRPIGGAAVLAAYLKKAANSNTIFVHAGDQVGASPANSALAQDEPAIAFANLLANAACRYGKLADPKCNVVGTLGNHEFDEGEAELLRLIQGGNYASGPFLERPWRGARFPYVCANVVRTDTQQPILRPYVIKRVGGVPIAFIGAVLHDTPTVVRASGVKGLTFLNEAEAINRYVPELHAAGVHAMVVVIHQGLEQARYEGPTHTEGKPPFGVLHEVIHQLDDDIDVIVSGHTHEFTNALVANANGVPMLVTQAFSAGAGFADIDLILDKQTKDVVSKTARIVNTWGDEGPGKKPDPAVAALVTKASARVATQVDVAIGACASGITRKQNEAGESALGNLIADAQRAAMQTDFAVINPGGIRADIDAGTLTWGTLYTVQPFRNPLVVMSITGQQLYDLLDQQWGTQQPGGGRILQISGFSYTWDPTHPEGTPRVREVRDARGPIVRTRKYTVAANAFLAEGGDGFSVFLSTTDRRNGPIDLDVFAEYLRKQPQPIVAKIEGRIQRR
jgi:5'-nucleotidase